MCYYVAIMANPLAEASLKDHFAPWKLWDCDNPSLSAHVHADYAAYWVTDGECSCSIYSRPIDMEKETKKIREKYSRLRYRKKGWTEKRIEMKISKFETAKRECTYGLSEEFLQLLITLPKSINDIHLIAHDMHGSISEEEVPIVGHIKMRFDDLPGLMRQAGWPGVRLNILYEITR